MEALWQTNRSLASSARWGLARSEAGRTQSIELAILVSLGILAALATSFATSGIRIPGHAILRGTLPLVLGVSLVPRRSAGTVMSIAAAATFGVLRVGGLGLPNPAAWVGVVALGPAIDAAVVGAKTGWRLYARFALAGLMANLAAFAARMALGTALITRTVRVPGLGGGGGNGMGGGRGLGGGLHRPGVGVEEFWMTALASFAACGALAGLVCGIVWFRARPRQEGSTAA
jgi:hypothetical protein